MALTWSYISSGVPFDSGGLAWVNGKFLAFDYGTTNTASSPQGDVWTAHAGDLPSAVHGIPQVAVHNNAVVNPDYNVNTGVAVGDVGGWIIGTLPAVSRWNAAASNGSVIIAVRELSFQVAASLDNGVTWALFAIGSAGSSCRWQGAAWNGTVFCIVDSVNEASATSTDGQTWVYYDSVLGMAAAKSLVWNGVRFIAMTSDGFCTMSLDGALWDLGSTIDGGVTNGWNTLHAFGRTLIAVRDVSGDIAISEDDGQTWTVTPTGLGPSQFWYGAANDGDTRVVIGSTNAVLLGISDVSILPIPPGPFWTGLVNCEEVA